MKRFILLALLLSACAPAVVKADPPVVIVTPPVPVVSPAPVAAPPVPAPVVTVPAPLNPRLDILDASFVTVTSPDEKTVTVTLTQLGTPVWLRVRLPNDTISEVTTSPAGAFIGLYAALPTLSLKYLPGLSVEVATNLVTADWVVAAKTK